MTALLKKDNYPWALVGSSLLFGITTIILHIAISLYIAPEDKMAVAIFMSLMTCMPLFFLCIILYGSWICILHYSFSDILFSSNKKDNLLLLIITIIIFCGLGNYIANQMNTYILLINHNQMSYFYMQMIISSTIATIFFIKTLHKPVVFNATKKEIELLKNLNKDNKNS